MNQMKETIMKYIFMLAACFSAVAVLLICLFLFANGLPTIAKIGPLKFLLGRIWQPTNEVFGIFPMIVASIYVTGGAIMVGVPIAILTAVFMARYCPKSIYAPLKSGIELMAGVPSIVYGFFGLVVLVPFIREHIGGRGDSMLAAVLLLGIMILPTIIGVSESAVRSVPESYYEGSLALGATKERSIYFVMLPAAKSGILAGVVLGIGRAIGETMAVVMVAGNQAIMPSGILKGVRTMTANIVMEMGYASGIHREALIATAVVLFVFILIINISLSLLNRRAENAA
ncbi:MAG: phosphate ABC transporter permease subunit PstC [Eubacteriales bacterium]|nr:phosphate ABC transporter permease subunit PstC [Eubacteriales bacterium]